MRYSVLGKYSLIGHLSTVGQLAPLVPEMIIKATNEVECHDGKNEIWAILTCCLPMSESGRCSPIGGDNVSAHCRCASRLCHCFRI